jgi:hypothetical protein
MISPDDWLEQQIADRPDDFSGEELEKAREWIGRIQRDAVKAGVVRSLVVMLAVLALTAVGALIHG